MKKNGRGSRARLESGAPHPIDIHVGSRVRLRRTLLGLSQGELAARLGLTFQQIQKYERGANRVSASRIFDMGRVLDVPVSFFFDDMPDDLANRIPGCTGDYDGHGDDTEANVMGKRETLELVRAYYLITDLGVRKKLAELTKLLGKTGADQV